MSINLSVVLCCTQWWCEPLVVRGGIASSALVLYLLHVDVWHPAPQVLGTVLPVTLPLQQPVLGLDQLLPRHQPSELLTQSLRESGREKHIGGQRGGGV